VKFSISYQNEEKYIKFMRNFKERKKNLISFPPDSEENNYIPMNFPLMLEYFNDRGKIRENVDRVKSGINKMQILTEYKKNQLNSPSSIDKTFNEKENLIHKSINMKNLYDRFNNVLNISVNNINRITEKYKNEYNTNTNATGNSSATNKTNFNETKTHLSKSYLDLEFINKCPTGMPNIYDFYSNNNYIAKSTEPTKLNKTNNFPFSKINKDINNKNNSSGYNIKKK